MPFAERNDFLTQNQLFIFLHKILHQLENRLVGVNQEVLVGVECGVIVLESIALFILKENARHVTNGKGIVIAVAS